jgi:hypothetical protein
LCVHESPHALLLSLLKQSDWTCYSVAPISVLTQEAFGHINPEQLVVVFLCANAISTACEPIILSRLGLRRTVLCGALFLMMGSIIKSGGIPPLIQPHLEKGYGEWRVYLGFFIVGLSQPLYQCTPALLSASWFPENERTMATGVALNANQLGIGVAFIFGTLLVKSSDDIPNYFSLLSIISTLVFLGTYIQFADAPPTPPSDTSRVMRGSLKVDLPSFWEFFHYVRNVGSTRHTSGVNQDGSDPSVKRFLQSTSAASIPDRSIEGSNNMELHSDNRESPGSAGKRSGQSPQKCLSTQDETLRLNVSSDQTRSASSSTTGSRKQQRSGSGPLPHVGMSSAGNDMAQKGHAILPSPVHYGSVADYVDSGHSFTAPSPMLPRSIINGQNVRDDEGGLPPDERGPHSLQQEEAPIYPYPPAPYPTLDAMPYAYAQAGGTPHDAAHPQYQIVWDPAAQQYAYYPIGAPREQPMYQQMPVNSYAYHHQPYSHQFESAEEDSDDPHREYQGADSTTPPNDFDGVIRDDQVILSIKACMSRPGFIHALVCFTTSGIVINTLSTFMDYLVRLNGAGREYTGIVGGTFQFVIMISSLIVGKFTDHTRAYYSVIIGMLVLGAFGLAECGVNLDSDKGTELRWSLVIVAALVGPLQPISTELGVDVVFPIGSENTVLVIQQLSANLLSALFIPCFKAFKDFGIGVGPANEGVSEQPQYTFSFYVLIILHAVATIFFATFNGRYLRYEAEIEKKKAEECRQEERAFAAMYGSNAAEAHVGSEQQLLIAPFV